MPKASLNPMAKVFVSGSKAGTTAKVDPTVAEFVPRPTILDALVVSFMGQGSALESRVPASISYTESRNYILPLTRLNPCAATFASNASLADDEEMIDAKDFLDFVEEPTSPEVAPVATCAQHLSPPPFGIAKQPKDDASDNITDLETSADATAVQRSAQLADVQEANSCTEDQMQRYKMDSANQSEALIHHFNWLGDPVFSGTATSPAASFYAIHATPKKEFSDLEINLRITTLLHKAYHVVDPILFDGDMSSLYDFSGTDLQNAVIGSCHKFYSKHGVWSRDEYNPDDDIPVHDTMFVCHYGGYQVILNGWYNDRDMPTRRDMFLRSAELAKQYHAARKPQTEVVTGTDGEAKLERVMKAPSVKSPLRRMVHHSELEEITFLESKTQQSEAKPAGAKRVNTSADLNDLHGAKEEDVCTGDETQKLEPLAITEAVNATESAATTQQAAMAWGNTLASLDDLLGPEDVDECLMRNVTLSSDMAPAALTIPHTRSVPDASPRKRFVSDEATERFTENHGLLADIKLCPLSKEFFHRELRTLTRYRNTSGTYYSDSPTALSPAAESALAPCPTTGPTANCVEVAEHGPQAEDFSYKSIKGLDWVPGYMASQISTEPHILEHIEEEADEEIEIHHDTSTVSVGSDKTNMASDVVRETLSYLGAHLSAVVDNEEEERDILSNATANVRIRRALPRSTGGWNVRRLSESPMTFEFNNPGLAILEPTIEEVEVDMQSKKVLAANSIDFVEKHMRFADEDDRLEHKADSHKSESSDASRIFFDPDSESTADNGDAATTPPTSIDDDSFMFQVCASKAAATGEPIKNESKQQRQTRTERSSKEDTYQCLRRNCSLSNEFQQQVSESLHAATAIRESAFVGFESPTLLEPRSPLPTTYSRI